MSVIRQGSFPLQGAKKLPNVTVAFPGEHWSNRVASGATITPGAAVVPVSSGGRLAVQNASASDSSLQLAIALRPVDVPDPNTGPTALGPNEVRNQEIAIGDYVHCYYSGAFHLTLVDPRRSYAPGTRLGWDVDGQRPSGKSGAGSWAPNANADIDDVFEVMEVRTVGSSTYSTSGEVILTVRSFRGQF